MVESNVYRPESIFTSMEPSYVEWKFKQLINNWFTKSLMLFLFQFCFFIKKSFNKLFIDSDRVHRTVRTARSDRTAYRTEQQTDQTARIARTVWTDRPISSSTTQAEHFVLNVQSEHRTNVFLQDRIVRFDRTAQTANRPNTKKFGYFRTGRTCGPWIQR